MNRGSAQHRHRTGVARLRFNEAPIHESGKYPPSLRSRAESSRFNEAPIHESGKSRCAGWTRAKSTRLQ